MSRLLSLTNNLSGTANDLTIDNIVYNPANQITSLRRTGDAYAFTGYGGGTTNYSSNGLNQQITIGGAAATWDSKGNLATEPQSGKTYGYSSENLLTSSSGGVTLSYDPAKRLYQVAGASTTRFAYDGSAAIAEYNGSGQLQRRFVFDPTTGQPVVQYEGTGTSSPRYLSSDERGSIVSQTDGSGALVGSPLTYDEFGRPGASNSGRYQYTGQKWIGDVGLYDYKARFYAAHLGQFVQVDPLGYKDSPNLYSYAGAEPIGQVDPTGMDVCGYVTGSHVRKCGAFLDTAEADVGAVPADLSAEQAQQGADSGGDSNCTITFCYLSVGLPNLALSTPLGVGTFDPLSSTDQSRMTSLLLNSRFVEILASAWNLTAVTGHEWGMFVWYRGASAGEYHWTLSPLIEGSTGDMGPPSGSAPDFPAMANGYYITGNSFWATVHTHPGWWSETQFPSTGDVIFDHRYGSIGIIVSRWGITYGR